jgi:hypothetical protein
VVCFRLLIAPYRRNMPARLVKKCTGPVAPARNSIPDISANALFVPAGFIERAAN